MALKLRAAQSVGGADGGSAWVESAFIAGPVSGYSTSVAQKNLPLGIGDVASASFPGGSLNPDSVASGSAIQSLTGATVCFATALAPNGALVFTVGVWRAGVLVANTNFGWAAGTPAFSALVPVALPVLGLANVPIRPNDVVVLSTSGAIQALPDFVLEGTM